MPMQLDQFMGGSGGSWRSTGRSKSWSRVYERNRMTVAAVTLPTATVLPRSLTSRDLGGPDESIIRFDFVD